MMDIERFQRQKVVDLKETLAAYCVLQFKLARKVHVEFFLLLFPFYRNRESRQNQILRCFDACRASRLGSTSKLVSRVYRERRPRRFHAVQTVTEQ